MDPGPGLKHQPRSNSGGPPQEALEDNLSPTTTSASFTLGEGKGNQKARSESIASPTREHPPNMPSAQPESRSPLPAACLHLPTQDHLLTAHYWMLAVTDKVNRLISNRPYRAMEWCDLARMPTVVRQCCQNMLVQNWTRTLPLIQLRSPAETACEGLAAVVNEVAKKAKPPLVIIDFCAGGGGPTPIFERLINDGRKRWGALPLRFILSDLWPNIPAWDEHSKKSDNLSYVEQSVDAAHSTSTAISITTPRKVSFSDIQHEYKESPAGRSIGRIFRLFNLSFHHFNDDKAIQVMRSTLINAEGFAIIELQDRRIGCLLMMALNAFLVLLVTPFWFKPFSSRRRIDWQNAFHNCLTYTLILPFVLCWDGLASCLRTREFEEVMEIVAKIEGVRPRIRYDHEKEVVNKYCEINDWTFHGRRQVHTLPFGYVNLITGIKNSESQG